MQNIVMKIKHKYNIVNEVKTIFVVQMQLKFARRPVVTKLNKEEEKLMPVVQ